MTKLVLLILFIGLTSWVSNLDASADTLFSEHGAVPNQLTTNQFIESKNGRYRLYMQNDGHVVLYNGKPTSQSAMWGSNTAVGGGRAPFRLTMQSDGNLVAYDKDNKTVWNFFGNGFKNYGFQGPFRAHLSDTGVFAVFDSNDNVMWQTGTLNGAKAPRDLWGLGIKYSQIEYYNGVASGVCNDVSHVIRCKAECKKALQKLGYPSEINWTGNTMNWQHKQIPSGCSITKDDLQPHFETSTTGLGVGREDLIPICKNVP